MAIIESTSVVLPVPGGPLTAAYHPAVESDNGSGHRAAPLQRKLIAGMPQTFAEHRILSESGSTGAISFEAKRVNSGTLTGSSEDGHT